MHPVGFMWPQLAKDNYEYSSTQGYQLTHNVRGAVFFLTVLHSSQASAL